MIILSENIGGVREINTQFKPGVSFYAAPNAAGKTSLVKSLVLPFEKGENIGHYLHAFSNKGDVRIEVDDQVFQRAIERSPKGIRFVGTAVKNADLIRLFAFADERNELLQAIRSGENLKEVILQYTGYAELKRELKGLVDRRDNLEQSAKRIKDAESEIKRLEEKVKKKDPELEKIEQEIQKHDKATVLTEAGKNLKDLNSRLSSISKKMMDTERTINALKLGLKSQEKTKKDLEKQIASAVVPDETKLEELTSELKDLEEEKSNLSHEAEQLADVIAFIQKQTSASFELYERVYGKKSGALDALLGDTTCCPVCAQKVSIDVVQKARAALINWRAACQARIIKIEDEQKRVVEEIKRANIREMLAKDLEKVETEIVKLTAQLRYNEPILAELRTNKAELEKEIDILTKASADITEVADLYKQSAALKTEIEETKKKAAYLRKQLVLLSTEADNLAEIEKKIQSVSAEMQRIEIDLIRQFNDEISEVFKRLKFSNIDQIKLNKDFLIEVVRKSDTGAGYLDTNSVNSLAKSEREITALVFMLTGYKLFDIRSSCPFIVVDDLEYLDKTRFNQLLNYYKGIADYLIVTTISNEITKMPEVIQASTELADSSASV